MKMFCTRHGSTLLASVALAGAAFAQSTTTDTTSQSTTTTATPGKTTTRTTTHERIVKSEQTAGKIASQPAVDVGAKKVEIPPVLERAIAAPYSMSGTASCAQIGAGMRDLSAALGPDFGTGTKANENRASKIAEAGGQAVVNSFIPFRGLVREVSGAAPAQRRLNAAMDAGYARRGFLRGLALAKKCKAG